MTGESPIPALILTGFLGSGKTTLLNYILREEHGKRIAIVENEAGEIDIDSDLVIASDEEIYEMANGCMCCIASVRSDLLEVFRKLVARQDRIDYIVIETSGLADPMPVAQSFFVDDPVLDHVTLDAIVALVDAAHIEAHLDDERYDGFNNQAVDQIISADRIIVNKVDLVEPSTVDRIISRVRRLNQRSKVATSSFAEVNLEDILGTRSFELSQRAAADPSFLSNDYWHGHDPGVETFAIRISGELDASAVENAAGAIADQFGADLLRWKGVLAVADHATRVALQGVHRMWEMHDLDLWSGEHRDSRVVFIGRKLERIALEQLFKSCATELAGRRAL